MAFANLLTLKTVFPLVLSLLGWFLAFIGVCVRQAEQDKISRGLLLDKNPNGLAWFSVFLNLLIIVGIAGAVFLNTLHQYKSAILAFVAIAVGLAIPDIDDTVYGATANSNDAGNGLSASGNIILCIAFFYWIIYIGSEHDSMLHNSLDSLGSLSSQIPDTPNSAPRNAGLRASDYQPQMKVNHHHQQQQQQQVVNNAPVKVAAPPVAVPQNAMPVNKAKAAAPVATKSATTATALYSYTRNPDDVHEVSFEKGESFEVLDSKGKWWKIKKTNGEMGIAPSNYLKML